METHTGKVRLQCQLCKEDFITKGKLRQHEMTHELEIDKPYSCIECQKGYNTFIAANSCEKIHTEMFKCLNCELSFRTNAELSRHMKTHDQSRPLFQCNQCPIALVSKKALELHARLKHKPGKTFIVCEECGRHSANMQCLSKHMKHCHGDIIYKCEYCKHRFRVFSKYKDHVKNQHSKTPSSKEEKLSSPHTQAPIVLAKVERKIGCSECGRLSLCMASLEKHKKEVHLRNKSFQCSECPSKFSREWSLSSHLKIHKGEKPYACSECSFKFRSIGALNQHKIQKHENDPLKPKRKFTCSECSMEFTRKWSLTNHSRIHTGELPYSCTECKLKLRTNLALVRHNIQKHEH